MIKIADDEFKLLVEFMIKNYGINLSPKRNFVENRLEKIFKGKSFENFCEYYKCLILDKTGKCQEEIVNNLTINYTFFMRESDHFNYFKNTILPYLNESEKDKKDLRVWSAGCATGEEAYTLAMILYDYFENENNIWDTKILATDISTNVIEIGKKGVYEEENIKVLPQQWKIKYFNEIKGNIREIKDQIKKQVIFRVFNLMNSKYPFKKKFHVIFCKNVMIYFDLENRKKLVDKFYECTKQGGYLFIGHSESLNFKNGFKYVMPSVYRKE
ncbi:protein-glutamate O-methyltransferase CheR [Clostridium aestuarii]|uniref:protein-glutamate O-methyltransferase n=1 Tax=Clostridium aestuarii TaxID=338193 RepID=A0ABT4D0P5_9CLOT|nr:protein-glutamate O-methyltransferase CheR [Clostridium aestuarii]MCY6484813.1 protein-glutamate O-methyltransferase CheR [Clostridium aestuarii]